MDVESIRWTRGKKSNILVASSDNFYILEQDFKLISDWCFEHNCGKRVSYDMFQFKNEQEIIMFLLRWS